MYKKGLGRYFVFTLVQTWENKLRSLWIVCDPRRGIPAVTHNHYTGSRIINPRACPAIKQCVDSLIQRQAPTKHTLQVGHYMRGSAVSIGQSYLASRPPSLVTLSHYWEESLRAELSFCHFENVIHSKFWTVISSCAYHEEITLYLTLFLYDISESVSKIFQFISQQHIRVWTINEPTNHRFTTSTEVFLDQEEP